MDYLSFLPEPMLAMTWFEDLLLVTPSTESNKFFLCNPLTRQWHALPRAPQKPEYFIRPYSRVGLTQKWSQLVVNTTLPQEESFCYVHPWNNGGVVACDGVLYWLSDIVPTSNRCAIIALDPFKGSPDDENRWRFIDLPADLNPRLRLARLPAKESDGIEVLRVWELTDCDDNGAAAYSWRLVHEVCIEGKEVKYIIGFDANNGDVIYVYSDNNICRYNIMKGEMQKIGKFPVPLEQYPLINGAVNLLNVFHIEHPWWPTPVHSLPSI
ncbi:hypothetical protein TIFTF001_035942 [Ficus carica]|uniref:F-box protein n=1 Tax=Ficus carica TaxID=3494 RepID=A0AA88E2T1_FICCA|nr:hypothetical protein TIFTF001_035942 [Ficus carica]